jgi:hypothetical protein
MLERGWRWCRRNVLPAALLGTVAVVLLLGTAAATGLLVYASGQAERADFQEVAAAKEKELRREADAARAKAEEEKGKRTKLEPGRLRKRT